MIDQSLPFWLEAFVAMMTEEDPAVSDVGLKTEVLGAVGFLLLSHAGKMTKFLPQMLPSVWQLFVGYVEEYAAIYITATAEEPEVVDDEDGEVLGLEALLSKILNVIRVLISSRKEYRAMIKGNLEDLMMYTLT